MIEIKKSSGFAKEEIPQAYKEIDEVVETTKVAGISLRMARLAPRVVIKG